MFKVGKQTAAECMPLIMEPLSAFYNSPLLVLDFQSLYPSVMIAYNYCYSTCIGRVVDFMGQNKFGVTELHQPPGLLERLRDHVNGELIDVTSRGEPSVLIALQWHLMAWSTSNPKFEKGFLPACLQSYWIHG